MVCCLTLYTAVALPRSSYVKYMRSVKKVALKLIETFTEKCEEPQMIVLQFVPQMLDPILGDYARSVPDARSVAVGMYGRLGCACGKFPVEPPACAGASTYDEPESVTGPPGISQLQQSMLCQDEKSVGSASAVWQAIRSVSYTEPTLHRWCFTQSAWSLHLG